MIFKQFISSVVTNDDGLKYWRKLDKDWLLEEEYGSYDAIQDHIDKYQKLPDKKTLEDFGFTVEELKEQPKFYLEQIEIRKQINIFNATGSIINEAFASKDMLTATDKLNEMIEKVRSINSQEIVSSLDVEAKLSLDDYEEGLYGDCALTEGVTTGFPFLDALNGGLYPGNLMVISGRPESGKTMLLMWMALNAWGDGNSILVASGEMSKREMTDRLLCMDAAIDPNKYIKRILDYWSIMRLKESQAKFQVRNKKYPFYFLDASVASREMTIMDIERVVAEYRPKIVAVDAVYLFSIDGKDTKMQDWQIVSRVLNKLKKIAEIYECVIVVTGQINKSGANSKKVLTLDQMADTDNYGKIAHMVIGIRKGQGLNSHLKREIGILKNRLGPGTGDEYTINYRPDKADFSENLGANIPDSGSNFKLKDFYNKL